MRTILCLLIFALWAVSLSSQPPPLAKAKRSQPPQNAAANKPNSADVPRDSAITVGSQAVTLGADKSEGKPQQDSPSNKFIAWFTGGLLVVAFLQFLAMKTQSEQIAASVAAMKEQRATMDNQLAEMRSAGAQTKELLQHASNQVVALMSAATATGIQAIAAQKSADAAEITARALINSERPWVAAEILKEGGANMFALKITNYGRTPAHILKSAVSHSTVMQASAIKERVPANDSPLVPQEKPFLGHEENGHLGRSLATGNPISASE
jgi:hypothetical protein